MKAGESTHSRSMDLRRVCEALEAAGLVRRHLTEAEYAIFKSALESQQSLDLFLSDPESLNLRAPAAPEPVPDADQQLQEPPRPPSAPTRAKILRASLRTRALIFEQAIPSIFTPSDSVHGPAQRRKVQSKAVRTVIGSDGSIVVVENGDAMHFEQPPNPPPIPPIDSRFYTLDYEPSLFRTLLERHRDKLDREKVRTMAAQSAASAGAAGKAGGPQGGASAQGGPDGGIGGPGDPVMAGRKHLVALIDAKMPAAVARDMKTLLAEIRPTMGRSKWASESRIGQEELYEALEKVLNELKAYKEHSFAFLAKVQKRDVPDYYDVIKNPMDLGTMTKNLKSLYYTSKNHFLQDLHLIWQNCQTYNPPKSVYRAHGEAMRLRAEELMRNVPDITIRIVRGDGGGLDGDGGEDDSEDEHPPDPTHPTSSRSTKTVPGARASSKGAKSSMKAPGHLRGSKTGKGGSKAPSKGGPSKGAKAPGKGVRIAASKGPLEGLEEGAMGQDGGGDGGGDGSVAGAPDAGLETGIEGTPRPAPSLPGGESAVAEPQPPTDGQPEPGPDIEMTEPAPTDDASEGQTQTGTRPSTPAGEGLIERPEKDWLADALARIGRNKGTVEGGLQPVTSSSGAEQWPDDVVTSLDVLKNAGDPTRGRESTPGSFVDIEKGETDEEPDVVGMDGWEAGVTTGNGGDSGMIDVEGVRRGHMDGSGSLPPDSALPLQRPAHTATSPAPSTAAAGPAEPLAPVDPEKDPSLEELVRSLSLDEPGAPLPSAPDGPAEPEQVPDPTLLRDDAQTARWRAATLETRLRSVEHFFPELQARPKRTQERSGAADPRRFAAKPALVRTGADMGRFLHEAERARRRQERLAVVGRLDGSGEKETSVADKGKGKATVNGLEAPGSFAVQEEDDSDDFGVEADFFLPELQFSVAVVPDLKVRGKRDVGWGGHAPDMAAWTGRRGLSSAPPAEASLLTYADFAKASPYPSAKVGKGLAGRMDRNVKELRKVQETHAKIAAKLLDNPVPAAPPTASVDQETASHATPVEGKTPRHIKAVPFLTVTTSEALLRQSAGRLLLHAGFQGSAGDALKVLTGVMGQFLLNLGKMARVYIDGYGGKMPDEGILRHTLLHNGIESLSHLTHYVRVDVVRHGRKVLDLRQRLEAKWSYMSGIEFGPEEAEVEQGDWADDDEAFVTGNIGDPEFDFLGLKELGLEVSQIPLELWRRRGGMSKSKLRAMLLKREPAEGAAPAESVPRQYTPPPPFVPITDIDLQVIALLRPMYTRRFESGNPVDALEDADERRPPTKIPKVYQGKLRNAARLVLRRRVYESMAQSEKARKEGKGSALPGGMAGGVDGTEQPSKKAKRV